MPSFDPQDRARLYHYASDLRIWFQEWLLEPVRKATGGIIPAALSTLHTDMNELENQFGGQLDQPIDIDDRGMPLLKRILLYQRQHLAEKHEEIRLGIRIRLCPPRLTYVALTMTTSSGYSCPPRAFCQRYVVVGLRAGFVTLMSLWPSLTSTTSRPSTPGTRNLLSTGISCQRSCGQSRLAFTPMAGPIASAAMSTSFSSLTWI